jgi:hypothetical protein
MTENTQNTEAPGSTTGADDTNANLTVDDLTASFVERVETDTTEDSDSNEATPTHEVEEAEALDEESDNVLSQSTSEDQTESAEEEEETAEEESEEQPKAVSKLLKQVGKLTARAKGAEETVEAMKAEIESIKSSTTPQDQETRQEPSLEEVNSFDELKKVQQEAVSAKKWAMSHIGKDFVETADGKEYNGDEIRQILSAADEYLTEKVPQRAEFLKSKAESDARSREVFDFWDSPENPQYQLYQQVLADPRYEALKALPNRDFVMGLIVEGFKSVNDKASKTTSKKKVSQKKPPSDLGDGMAPPKETLDSRQKKARKAALGTGNVREDQLAAFLTT